MASRAWRTSFVALIVLRVAAAWAEPGWAPPDEKALWQGELDASALKARTFPARSPIEPVVLAPSGVAAIEALFVRSIAEAVSVRFRVAIPPILGVLDEPGDRFTMLPKLGGEAYSVQGRLELAEIPDWTRSALTALAAASCEAPALERVYADFPDAMRRVDRELTGQVLELTLKRLPSMRQRGVAEERLLLGLCHSVGTVLANGLEAYSPDERRRLIVQAGHAFWARPIGRWYLAPPRRGPTGWLAGAGVGVHEGGGLAISFDPDGFDLYDTSDPRFAVIRYRSAEWRRRFQARWRP